MEAIQYKGLDAVSDEHRLLLDRLSAEYYDKIKRSVRNENCSLQVHIKSYNAKGGGEGKEKKNAKYSVHAKVVAPTKIFEASAADWDFAKTLHMVFNELETEINHHFKKA